MRHWIIISALGLLAAFLFCSFFGVLSIELDRSYKLAGEPPQFWQITLRSMRALALIGGAWGAAMWAVFIGIRKTP